MAYDSTQDTNDHNQKVYDLLVMVVEQLAERAVTHDLSKLKTPEKPILDLWGPRLQTAVYGSIEYKRCIREMSRAMKHHFAENRHHPEHFGEANTSDMNLIDLIEMLCDWKADDDIMGSIDINQKRFGYSDELAQIFRNTAEVMNG